MPEPPGLTPVLRREIRERWFAGQTSDEIADALGLEPKTVRQVVNTVTRDNVDEHARERLLIRWGVIP